ncbi:hypothetical protein SDC9_201618 [bioreactor metagenome]|uniref:Uncharacterized protein n=1 Tax=bioreactor metagenome TaxID=1076179 RepID=A0A645IU66_9ZZZZ
MGNHAVFNMAHKRGMDAGKGTGRQSKIFNAHFGDLFQHHVDHIVPVAEMVMEGDGHAVLQAALFDGLPEAVHNFIIVTHAFKKGMGRFFRHARKGPVLRADFRDVGNAAHIQCHLKPPPPLRAGPLRPAR